MGDLSAYRPSPLRRGRARATEHALVLAVLGFVATMIATVSITEFPLADATVNDSLPYAAMTGGAPLAEIPKPFRYRVAVPFLAHLFPHGDPHQIQVAWGVLDVGALTLAGWATFLLLRRCRFAVIPSLLGSSLLFSSWVVVRYSGGVLVDATSYAVLALAAYAVVRRRTVLLLLTVLVGMTVRETTALVVVFVLLVGGPRPEILRKLAACVPGLALYAVIRLSMPTDLGYSYSLGRVAEALATLATGHGLAYAVLQFGLTFGPVWVLAAIGWWAATDPPLPRRTAWLVPITLAVPYLVGSNLDRVWFLAFPVVIPFAVAGVEVVGRWADAGRRTGPVGTAVAPEVARP